MTNQPQTARAPAREALAITPIDTASKALALVPNSLDGAMQLARWLSMSTFLPDKLRGKEGDIFAIMLAGAELGLPPMATLRGVYIVNGKPALEAKTKAAICLERGAAKYFRKIEDTPQAVTWETLRAGDAAPRVSRYTIVEAKAAGLLNKDGPWQSYPQRMLGHRALGWLCDDAYPDIVLGVSTKEDFDDAEFTFTPIGAGVDLGVPKGKTPANATQAPPPTSSATSAAPPTAPATAPATEVAPPAAGEAMTNDEASAISERIHECADEMALREIARVDVAGSKRTMTNEQRDFLAKAYSMRLKEIRAAAQGGAA